MPAQLPGAMAPDTVNPVSGLPCCMLHSTYVESSVAEICLSQRPKDSTYTTSDDPSLNGKNYTEFLLVAKPSYLVGLSIESLVLLTKPRS